MQPYKFLPHTADVKFQAFGNNLEEVFSNCVKAMVKVICHDVIEQEETVKLSVKGKDLKGLLYNFLEEFLFLFETKHFVFSEVKSIKINEETFEAEVEVVGDSSKNYKIDSHVKAVTYNEMIIQKEKDFWIAQVVLDV